MGRVVPARDFAGARAGGGNIGPGGMMAESERPDL
jgi:hypothetical protein